MHLTNLESEEAETALTTFNGPTPITTLVFSSMPPLSAEVKRWGGIAIASAVAPAVLQAGMALASTSFLVPLGVSIVAATMALEDVREAVLQWLRRFRPPRKL